MKKTLFLIVTLLLFSLLSFSALADDEPEIFADFAGVYNVESGTFLYEKSVDTIIYPASLVKIMTAVISLEFYENNIGSDLDVTVTESALETLEGNSIKLKVGEEVSFYDLIASVVIGSANDSALVLAETIAGSVDNFVTMMNDKAKSLGANNTVFANPTGYHSPYMYSTVSDLAKICEWASRNKKFMTLSSTLEYEMPETNLSKKRVFTNSNLLLDPTHWLRHYKSGTKGMNVGMTYESGYSLATVYTNDGQTNIVIIIGGKSEGYTYHYFNDAVKLIDYTSKDYAYRTLVEKNKPVADVPILYGKDTDHVLVTTEREAVLFVPKDALDSEFTYDFELKSERLIAPVALGEVCGNYNVYYNGELIDSIPLVTGVAIKRDLFLFVAGNVSDFFGLDIVEGVVGLFFSILFFAVSVAYIVIYFKRKRRLEREKAERLKRLSKARREIKQNVK